MSRVSFSLSSAIIVNPLRSLLQPSAIKSVKMVANAQRQESVPAGVVTPATAAKWISTSARATWIIVTKHRRVSICPVGTTVVANQATGSASTIVPRVHSVSISTNATTKRSRGGTPVILVPRASTPKEATCAVVHHAPLTITLWRNVGWVSIRSLQEFISFWFSCSERLSISSVPYLTKESWKFFNKH